MTTKVIQGSFLGGRPKLAAVQSRIAAPPPIQTKIAAPAPPTAFAGRPPGPPIPAFAARPSGPPATAFALRMGAVQRHGAGNAFAVDSGALGLASGGGRPLPDAVRGQMEAALGADFSNVRVHVGPQAERIGAIAFTVGSDIYFAPGRYQPDTMQGRQLLGHELTHVVQQRAGRVRNPHGSGLAVVQDHALEAEADRLGQRAARQATTADIRRLRPAVFRRGRRNGSELGTPHGPTDRGRLYPTAMQRSGIVQCRRIVNVQITGITHLREASRDGSLVRGSDFAEVAFPDSVAIDLDDIWDSRLGINLHVAKTPSYVWYRVVAHGGVPLDDRREVYLRDGMFRMGTPSVATPTVSVSSAPTAGQSVEERAASIVETALAQASALRMQQENTETTFRQTTNRDIVIREVAKSLRNIGSDKNANRMIIANLYAFIICEQPLLEANNRFAYFVITQISDDLPDRTKIASREKISFLKKTVRDQFLKMYDS